MKQEIPEYAWRSLQENLMFLCTELDKLDHPNASCSVLIGMPGGKQYKITVSKPSKEFKV